MAVVARASAAAALALGAAAARACPVCHSPLGEEVRAGLLGADLLRNGTATLLPFPILAAIVLLVRRFGLPGAAPRLGAGREELDAPR